jgi:hypothetical protein
MQHRQGLGDVADVAVDDFDALGLPLALAPGV